MDSLRCFGTVVKCFPDVAAWVAQLQFSKLIHVPLEQSEIWRVDIKTQMDSVMPPFYVNCCPGFVLHGCYISVTHFD